MEEKKGSSTIEVEFREGEHAKCKEKNLHFETENLCKSRNELLLTLMKIRLRLLNEDLVDRFSISVSRVSKLFTTLHARANLPPPLLLDYFVRHIYLIKLTFSNYDGFKAVLA